MKANIHPEYKSTVARCACGNEFEVDSTKENIRVEICSKCHPFYTGNRSRIVDTTGRVDRFKKK
jgi:large subunit ribosomal protein L31